MWPQPKASWPLVLVAALALIPVLGFFFAAAGLTWGLLSDRPRARVAIGLSIVGALLTCAEIAGLMYYTRGNTSLTEAQATVARESLGKIVLALEDYRSKNGEYPPDLPTLVGRPIPVRFLNISDQTAGLFSTRTFQYVVREDGTYDVFGVGRDGQAHTADDIRPVLSDSVKASAGYRPGP